MIQRMSSALMIVILCCSCNKPSEPAEAALTPSAPPAQSDDGIYSKYNVALECGAHMGALTVLAERIGDKTMAAGFEAATERHMREAVRLGERMNKSEDAVIDEFKKHAASNPKVNTGYSESAIETFTKSCAPENLPLLK